MTDITLDLAVIEVRPRNIVISSPVAPAATPGPAAVAPTWRVAASTIFGSITADLVQARVLGFQYNLNAPMSATFTVPFDDPNVQELPLAAGYAPDADSPFNREVKIYRNGSLFFWGPCVTRRANSIDRVWTYTAYDPLWYLLHRYFGEADRHNYLTNGGFDLPGGVGGFGSWAEIGSPTGSIDNLRYVNSIVGSPPGASAQLSMTTSDSAYIYQSFSATSGNQGLAFIATAWVFVDSMVEPGTSSAGLKLLRIGASGPGAAGSVNIDMSTPRQQWIRLSCAVLMPPNVTETIQIRLYVPHGTVHWDACSVVIEESLSFVNENRPPGSDGWDQVQIAQQTVRYAAGGLPVGDPYTKSGLHIGYAGALSGILKERTYQFFNHQKIYGGGTGGGALDEWAASADGFDFRIEISETSRIFTTYFPAVGTIWDPDDLTLEYVRTFDGDGVPDGHYQAITQYDWGETIEGTANDVTIMGGWGSGAGREEGGASNTFLGDLTLELVESAPSEAQVDLLDSIAQWRLVQTGQVLQAPTLTLIEPRDPDTGEVATPLVGVLLPGDLVACTIDDGGLQFSSEAVRILQVAYDAVAETLQVSILPNGFFRLS